MTTFTEIELHIYSDLEGNAEADTDKDVAAERFEENIGGLPEHYRVIKLRIPTPTAIEVTLPASDVATVA